MIYDRSSNRSNPDQSKTLCINLSDVNEERREVETKSTSLLNNEYNNIISIHRNSSYDDSFSTSLNIYPYYNHRNRNLHNQDPIYHNTTYEVQSNSISSKVSNSTPSFSPCSLSSSVYIGTPMPKLLLESPLMVMSEENTSVSFSFPTIPTIIPPTSSTTPALPISNSTHLDTPMSSRSSSLSDSTTDNTQDSSTTDNIQNSLSMAGISSISHNSLDADNINNNSLNADNINSLCKNSVIGNRVLEVGLEGYERYRTPFLHHQNASNESVHPNHSFSLLYNPLNRSDCHLPMGDCLFDIDLGVISGDDGDDGDGGHIAVNMDINPTNVDISTDVSFDTMNIEDGGVGILSSSPSDSCSIEISGSESTISSDITKSSIYSSSSDVQSSNLLEVIIADSGNGSDNISMRNSNSTSNTSVHHSVHHCISYFDKNPLIPLIRYLTDSESDRSMFNGVESMVKESDPNITTPSTIGSTIDSSISVANIENNRSNSNQSQKNHKNSFSNLVSSSPSPMPIKLPRGGSRSFLGIRKNQCLRLLGMYLSVILSSLLVWGLFIFTFVLYFVKGTSYLFYGFFLGAAFSYSLYLYIFIFKGIQLQQPLRIQLDNKRIFTVTSSQPYIKAFETVSQLNSYVFDVCRAFSYTINQTRGRGEIPSLVTKQIIHMTHSHPFSIASHEVDIATPALFLNIAGKYENQYDEELKSNVPNNISPNLLDYSHHLEIGLDQQSNISALSCDCLRTLENQGDCIVSIECAFSLSPEDRKWLKILETNAQNTYQTISTGNVSTKLEYCVDGVTPSIDDSHENQSVSNGVNSGLFDWSKGGKSSYISDIKRDNSKTNYLVAIEGARKSNLLRRLVLHPVVIYFALSTALWLPYLLLFQWCINEYTYYHLKHLKLSRDSIKVNHI